MHFMRTISRESCEALMIFTDGWRSSNDIHETINYCYDQIWEMTIVLKLSYDLPHEPVPKLMSSRVLVPIRDIKTYANVQNHSQQSAKFFVHNTVHTYTQA